LEASPYDLGKEDIEGLVQFAADCSRLLGGALQKLSLDGEPDALVVAVVFTDQRQRPGILYSYEWRLGHLDDPEDANPLATASTDTPGSGSAASPMPRCWCGMAGSR
jgi:hypothetical protein